MNVSGVLHPAGEDGNNKLDLTLTLEIGGFAINGGYLTAQDICQLIILLNRKKPLAKALCEAVILDLPVGVVEDGVFKEDSSNDAES